MPRLGIVGTMVWDTIRARDIGREAPVREWGGIAYALAAADAALGEDWSLFPIIKIGQDMREAADVFLGSLERLDSLDGVRTVPEPNNRVELVYRDDARRCEKLTGGVPGWTAEEVLPLARSCDAVYVNFIAGWELDLPAAAALRPATAGSVYADLHSLMLGVGADGVRAPRPLADWRAWLSCFDIVQLNEDELMTLAAGWDDPWALAADVVGPVTRGLLVTLGERGSAWVATRSFREAPTAPRAPLHALEPAEALVSGKVEPESAVAGGDPTGCGDVWGATCFATMLGGEDLEDSMRAATRAARQNAGFRGATGLGEFLRSETGLLTGAARARERGPA
ncbi:hypothetical protein [Candidatus Palauibacter sp.]|uniref:hypothetical protein n=1 Tax=Candidatus Palauibacter sp. TaxID=3101350 RepID=UPI003C6EDC3F